ncbi:MAG: excinuclease ABC subunit UvrA [Deltaproteobacteria bacterium]|nr:excinuclease ABC subunit UvrA [Deltaproteobacteria bacterium]
MHPIRLRGARTHNLKGLDLELRPGELVCVTGVSGAGKSSLCLDTLYAEGQRRFVESFSPYARQFLERLERPPMDELDPVAAAVAVDRRAPIKSSRSTLATMADLEAYLAALFAREAEPLCPDCGRPAERRDAAGAARTLLAAHGGRRAVVTYPLRARGTEEYLEVREQLLRDGYRRLLVGAQARDLDGLRPAEALAAGGRLDVVVDRLRLDAAQERRVGAALEQAWERGAGRAALHLADAGGPAARVPCVRGLSCPGCGRELAPPPRGLFSYQSPLGACPQCRGFGRIIGIDWDKVAPDPSLSLERRALRPWSGPKAVRERRSLRLFCERRGIPLDVPWADLEEGQRAMILEGEGTRRGGRYPGVRAWFRWLETKSYKMHVRVFLARYRSYDPCPSCAGKRLSPQALAYRVGGLDLGDWHALELRQARARLAELVPASGQGEIARAELVARLGYLERVGLGYLSLDRQARTLSGGEAQRVALTAALGTSLTGALFVLDEPTVGLHPADLPPLVEAMRELAARGNAVLVVEHDPAVIAAADRVLELGPGAGADGGALTYDGPPQGLAGRTDLATGRALGACAAPRRVPRESTGAISVHGARANNLKDVTVSFPLGAVVAVCGPSGSGKSSLVEEVLYRALARARGYRDVDPPGPYRRIEGATPIRTVTFVDQSPLGRTSRGNAATYTGAWSRMRLLLAAQPEAIVRGLGPGAFSFNVAGGRCEACAGEGAETVEMQFLADVRLTCPVCQGRRFREDVLEVKLGGRSAADLLAMSVAQALELFDLEAQVTRALRPLARLGLGYLRLGQPLSTLSGGEAQRLRLARALHEAVPGTLVLLDEPSAGLHAEEVGLLGAALGEIVDAGASVVVVDHDLDVIAGADWVIELGPGAGAEGGCVVAEGTPAELAARGTLTARALGEARAAAARRRDQRASPRGAGAGARARAHRAIAVTGAREHNLAGIDVAIPHGKLVVVTGPSGSGKSSLAFDVVFAEGQRRFLETLTPYARQFLPMLPRPDVDRVAGVPPSVALEQRTARAGAGSTVATVTEVAHYLRLLYAKVGEMHCPDCDEPVQPLSPDELYAKLRRRRGRATLRAPVVRARKGLHVDVLTAAARAGIAWAMVDGKLASTDRPPRLELRREHSIDLVIHDGPLSELDRSLFDRALGLGRGQLVLAGAAGRAELLSTARACGRCGRALPELDPRHFSCNTRQGCCPDCEGTGLAGGREAQKLADAAEADGAAREELLAPCPSCGGARLAPVPRAVRLAGERYHECCARSVQSALERFSLLRLHGAPASIAAAPLAELRRRLRFVAQVGLGYLTLERRAATLSGGEMQRLRLGAQLGSGLTGALYVLDEPTVGLHPRDTGRLLANLRALVDTGSTVLVVEHDADTIRAADELIDLGPGGGRAGGRVVAAGPPAEVLCSESSPTARALRDERGIFAARQRLGTAAEHLVLRGARQNNLRIEELRLPAQRLCVVAGVSGSGKSTLVGQVLYPAARRALGRAPDRRAGRAGAHTGLELPPCVRRALCVDQSPIGRTPRSVPATFLGVWDEIRKLFAATPEARARGYRPTRFSYNSATGGRCETCAGRGVIAHEMAFLPDVTTTCEACGGARFEPATLDVRYLGLSAAAVLRLTAIDAVDRFRAHPRIAGPLQTLCDLGVGYVPLGQGSHTLSGGEAQRLKLAAELTASVLHQSTLYVLDEPTTGLHHSDVGKLVTFLDRLVRRGDSLVVIEHHPAVIAAADHVVELGPEGGDAGGLVVAEGPPEHVARCDTPTGAVLRRLL